MHQALHIRVTVHARKHAAVHRVLELVLVNGEADRGAVCVCRGEGRVGVAGEAVRVFELLRGERGGGPDKNNENERREPKKPYGFHI